MFHVVCQNYYWLSSYDNLFYKVYSFYYFSVIKGKPTRGWGYSSPKLGLKITLLKSFFLKTNLFKKYWQLLKLHFSLRCCRYPQHHRLKYSFSNCNLTWIFRIQWEDTKTYKPIFTIKCKNSRKSSCFLETRRWG